MTTDAETYTTVTTTYLHMTTREQFRPSWQPNPDVLVMEAREPLPAFYQFLYRTVGWAYYWRDRLYWAEEQLAAYLVRPAITLLVLYVRGTPAGYIELNRESEEPGTEIAYFGLISAFHGRGLGKHLLSAGVQQAFDTGAQRVWLHTCTLDGPHALANYQARGFVPYRSISAKITLPPGNSP